MRGFDPQVCLFFFFFFIPAIVPLVKGVRAFLIINSDALLTLMAPVEVSPSGQSGEDHDVNPEVRRPIPSRCLAAVKQGQVKDDCAVAGDPLKGLLTQLISLKLRLLLQWGHICTRGP